MKRITTFILLFLTISIFCGSFSIASATTETELLSAPELEATKIDRGIQLTWTQVEGAEGYKIYRRVDDTAKWKLFYTTRKTTKVKLVNSPTAEFADFEYKIRAFNEAGLGDESQTVQAYWLAPSSITSLSQKGKTVTIEWASNSQADGYTISYCLNRFFNKTGAINVTGEELCSKVLELKSSSTYYIRIRSYKVLENGTKVLSPWSYSPNVTNSKTATIKRIDINGKALELQKATKQSVGGYDTVQGGCYANNYGYFALYNRNKEKCKIAKVNIKTGELIKVSRKLDIAHGNDLTYNPEKNYIVAAHSGDEGQKISIINPDTLKVDKTYTISLDAPLPGLTESKRARYQGVGAIAYNEKYDQYVARVKSLNGFLILNTEFEPLKYVQWEEKIDLTYQGMDTIGDYLLVGQSYKNSNSSNIIAVYDWNGQFISKITVRKGYELENVFHSGSTVYTTFYRSFYQPTCVVRYKWKFEDGKFQRVEVRLEDKRLERHNYIYQVKM